MNKTKVKIICMITIVLIIIVQLCGKVKAEDNVKVAENKNYIEGEAIIILKSNERYTTLSAMKSNLNEESIWDDLTVYKELDFKENNDNKKSYSVASAQNNGEIMKYLFEI